MATLLFKVNADYDKVIRLRDEIKKLETQMRSFNASTPKDQIKSAEARLTSLRAGLNHLTKEAAVAGSSVSSSFKEMAKSATALFSIQAASQFARQIASVRGEFQQLEVAFETMLQSKEKSDALMSQIVDTAAKTPFDLQGVASGAKQLLAYGVASDKVNDTLIRLGDIAAGLSIPLGDLVYLYGTTMAQGRMFTMDLRQFQGRGIPMTEELAKVMGVAKNEVAGLVTAGKVGFPEMEQAIVNMTSAGGKFAGLMEKQSKTITGQMSNLQDAVDQMLNEIGKSSEGVISGAISTASTLVENYEKVGRIIGGLVTAYGAAKAAIMAVNVARKAHIAYLRAENLAKKKNLVTTTKTTAATVLAEKAQKALNKAILKNPYVIAAAAVAGLCVGIYALVTAKSKEEKIHERVNKEIDEYNKKVDESKAKLTELFNVIKDPDSTEMQKVLAMEELKELYPSIIKGLSDEEIKTMAVTDAQKKLNDELERTRKIELSSKIQELSDAYEKANAKMNERRRIITRNVTDGFVDNYLEGDEEYKKASKEAEEYRIELEKRLTEFKRFIDATKKAEFNALSNPDKIASLDNTIANYDAEIARLDKELSDVINKPREIETSVSFDFNPSGSALPGQLWDGMRPQEDIESDIKVLQTQKQEAERERAAVQKIIDEGNKTLTDKQKLANYRRKEAARKAADDLEKTQKDLEFKVSQSRIDAMQEGFAKESKQLILNNAKQLEQYDREKKDLLKKMQDEEKRKWLAEDPENRKEYDFKTTITEDSEAFKPYLKMFDTQVNLANASFIAAKQDLLNKYGSIETQKEALAKKWDNDIAVLEEEAKKSGDNTLVEIAKKEKELAVATLSYDYYSALGTKEQQLEALKQKLDAELALVADGQKAVKEAANNVEITEFIYGDPSQYTNLSKAKEATDAIFKAKIAQAKAQKDANKEAELEVQWANALYNLNKKFSADYALIFAEASSLTESQLALAITKTKEEIEKATPNTEAYIELLKQLRAQLEVQINNKGWGFSRIIDGFKNLKTARDKYETALKSGDQGAALVAEGEIGAYNNAISTGITEVTDAIGGLGGAMQSFGGTVGEIGEAFSKMSESMAGVGDALTSGDKGAIITSAISGVLDLVTMVGNQISENKQAQEEWNATVEQAEHKYRMLQIEAMEYKPANIFGVENPYKKAIDNANVYAESMRVLNEEQKKLAEGQVQTGTTKEIDWGNVGAGVGSGAAAGAAIGTAIGGWAAGIGTAIGAAVGAVVGGITGLIGGMKTVPILDNLVENYGWLYDDKTYELNPQIIADYDKLDDTTKQIVDNWEEVRNKALEAEKEMKDSFASLSGDIGGQLSDSLVEAFRNGNLYDAIDDFHQKMTSTIEDIMEQIVFSSTFGKMFDELEDKMFKSFDAGGDQDIVDDLIWMEQEYANRLSQYEEAMSAVRDSLKNLDYDLWDNEEITNQSASTKGYQTLSEDTGSELAGRALAQYEATLRIEESVRATRESIDRMASSQISIRDIAAESRALIADSYLELQQIRENTKAIVKPIQNMSAKIDSWDTYIKSL